MLSQNHDRGASQRYFNALKQVTGKLKETEQGQQCCYYS